MPSRVVMVSAAERAALQQQSCEFRPKEVSSPLLASSCMTGRFVQEKVIGSHHPAHL